MSSSDKRKTRRESRPTSAEAVAAIHAQWQQERPDIDPGPVWVYGLLGRVQLEGTQLINRALAPLGLTRPSYDVLTALRRAGPPYALTPKQIARSLLLSGSGLTSRINTLEEKRLVARMPEPSDRRTHAVQLTLEGLSVVDRAIPLVFEVQRQSLEGLGEAETRALVEALRQVSGRLAEIEAEAAEAAGAEGSG
ncbi:MarR family winged helix-turn-helix transcriptional regulator [Poseidonocella sp. HB161398]|uniref:MarR family winged helix-turn-helix transcriptional regulator n=1 Tax=Poseidonocella sp. HB161398 TaxID=2320855 RepID=UPI001108216E|nr:MarR family transcriptional regulator [Poseidonocella sp. HB161398]